MKTTSIRNDCIYTGLLGIQYFVSGSVYISQMYHLYNFISGDMVTIIALRWNYIAQALGMLAFILLFLKAPKLAGNRMPYGISVVIGTVFTAVSLLSNNGLIAVSFTIAFNILIGLYSGYTLTLLTANIAKKRLGFAFAIAYAFGSIGTYLISIMGNGNFLHSKYVIILFAVFNMISLLLLYISKNISIEQTSKNTCTKQKQNKILKQNRIQDYLLIIVVLILVNAISSLGNNFQFSTVVEANANLPFSRAFYAISLICAGLISMRSRKYLALTTFAFLLYPVIAVNLAGDTSSASVALTLSYLFLGFVSVYRSLITMDIAAEKKNPLAFSCLGLMVSRLVEASSTWFSNITTTNKLLAAILFTLLFALLIFVFFIFLQKVYPYPSSSLYEISDEDKLLEFNKRYNFTARENEVFQLLLKGIPSREIAQMMYITENTVKFHIKHILKKTDCSNRLNLLALYNSQNNYDVIY